MWRSARWTVAVLVLSGLSLAACSRPQEASQNEPAVMVEENEATGLSRLAMSAKATERLGIDTAPVTEEQFAGGVRTVIPYSAVVYDKDGATWAYTNPEGRVFVRHEITIERIEANKAVLAFGPPLGTSVVTVGAAELWGVEIGVGGGH